MTVDDLIAEGEAFLATHPGASSKKVRIYLETRTRPTTADERRTAANAAGDPNGCLGALVLMPVLAVVDLFRQRRHRRRVDQAMRSLFPTRRKNRRPAD